MTGLRSRLSMLAATPALVLLAFAPTGCGDPANAVPAQQGPALVPQEPSSAQPSAAPSRPGAGEPGPPHSSPSPSSRLRAALFPQLPASGGAGGPSAVAFRVVDDGFVSARTTRLPLEAVVVDSPAAWAAIWNEVHANGWPVPTVPAVDFTRERVVLALAGRPARGVAVTSAAVDGTRLRIGVEVTDPSPTCVSTTEIRSPYAFVAVPAGAWQTVTPEVSHVVPTC